ncbi:pre-peptidase C-terminal domain-containing protein, partial [Microcystis sp.]
MTAGADVQLLNSSGSVIASSTNGGTASESITSQLSAGTYYIRVYPYTGDTNYNLAVSATTATVTPGYSA